MKRLVGIALLLAGCAGAAPPVEQRCAGYGAGLLALAREGAPNEDRRRAATALIIAGSVAGCDGPARASANAAWADAAALADGAD